MKDPSRSQVSMICHLLRSNHSGLLKHRVVTVIGHNGSPGQVDTVWLDLEKWIESYLTVRSASAIISLLTNGQHVLAITVMRALNCPLK